MTTEKLISQLLTIRRWARERNQPVIAGWAEKSIEFLEQQMGRTADAINKLKAELADSQTQLTTLTAQLTTLTAEVPDAADIAAVDSVIPPVTIVPPGTIPNA